MEQQSEPRWIEPGLYWRVYYFLVVPLALLTGFNGLVLAVWGVEANYEMWFEISRFGSSFRQSLYYIIITVIEGLPFGLFVAFVLFGSLPFKRSSYWNLKETPAYRAVAYRRKLATQKSKIIVVDDVESSDD